jgi:uncharacterized protein involved in outer membrane biogenesis
MKKFIIIGSIILTIFIGLLIITWLNLNKIINKNRDLIITRAERVLHRKIEIEYIGVSFKGGIGILLKEVRLKDDPYFSRKDLLYASSLQVNVRFWPLLHKEFHIKKILLYNPIIYIIRNKKGEFNFGDIIRKEESRKRISKPETSTLHLPQKDREALPLLISLVNVRNGKISYIDKKNKAKGRLTIHNIDLNIKNIGYNHPIKVNLSAKLVDSEEKNIIFDGDIGPFAHKLDFNKVNVKGKLRINLADPDKFLKTFQKITQYIPGGIDFSGPFILQADIIGRLKALKFNNIRLRASIFGAKNRNLQIKGGEIGPINLKLPFKKQSIKSHIELKPVRLENLRKFTPLRKIISPDIKISGPISLIGDINGSLQKLQMKVIIEASQSDIKLTNGIQKPRGVPTTLSLNCQVEGNNISCSDIKIRLYNLEGKGSGRVQLENSPKIDFTFNSNKVELKGWEHIISALREYKMYGSTRINLHIKSAIGKKIPTIKGKAEIIKLNSYIPQLGKNIKNINGLLIFTGNYIYAKDITLLSGASKIRLIAKIYDFTKPVINYELYSQKIKLSDFLKSGKIKRFHDNILQEVVIKGGIRSTSKVAIIKEMHFKVFDGLFKGKGTYSFKENRFNFISEIIDMDLKSLIKAIGNPDKENLTGRLKLNLQIKGRGSQWKAIQQTLYGRGKAEIEEGALLDINIPKIILSKLTGIPFLTVLVSKKIKGKYAPLFKEKDTMFDKAKCSFFINKGIVETKDLLLATKYYTIIGKGWVGFNKNIDFYGNLIMGKEFSQDIMSNVREMKSIANKENLLSFPFRISGTISNINPKPDIAIINKKIQRAVIRKGVEKLMEKLFPQKKNNKEN